MFMLGLVFELRLSPYPNGPLYTLTWANVLDVGTQPKLESYPFIVYSLYL